MSATAFRTIDISSIEALESSMYGRTPYEIQSSLMEPQYDLNHNVLHKLASRNNPSLMKAALAYLSPGNRAAALTVRDYFQKSPLDVVVRQTDAVDQMRSIVEVFIADEGGVEAFMSMMNKLKDTDFDLYKNILAVLSQAYPRSLSAPDLVNILLNRAGHHTIWERLKSIFQGMHRTKALSG